MGLADVQKVMARLYIDPEVRNQFFGDPTTVGADARSCRGGNAVASPGPTLPVRAIRKITPSQTQGSGAQESAKHRARAGGRVHSSF